MSVPPPGANGVTMRIGLVGYFCCAGFFCATAPPAAAKDRAMQPQMNADEQGWVIGRDGITDFLAQVVL
jgi:hypothetical protein